MSTSILTRAQDFRFVTKGGSALELHGVLMSWTESIRIRLAHHEYLKRDGGEVEPMGAAQGRWSYRCVLAGPDVSSRWKGIVATIRREPRGQLTDPRLGMINAACEGAQAIEDPEKAIDVLEFAIDFVEDAVDTAVVTDADVGPSSRASQLSDAINNAAAASSAIVTNHIANTVYAAVTVAIAKLSQLAAKFSLRAQAAAQSTAPDPTLDKLLGNVLQARDSALVALTKTLPYTQQVDASLTTARIAVYVVYAAASQLYNAVIAQKPPIVPFTVPTAMPLTSVAVRLYGKDARAKMDELYLLNRIPTPYWIPAGTVLRVVSPSVRQ